MNPIELQNQFEVDVYPKRDVVLVGGAGSKVWDADGKEYIDCAAGHGVASLGHCHPAIVEAVSRQMRTLITCPGTYYNDVRARALERLVRNAPPGIERAFLCNCGAESVEAAIKFARISTGRTDFVCANRGFHGRTCGALSATYNPDYKTPFEPLLPGFVHVPFNDLAKFEAAVTPQTAGVILEVVQGEGGVHLGEREFLRGTQDLCRRSGALLIVDEIQTGFCRTGRMFACMHHDLEPDLLCVAKAVAGGLPMGATLCSARIQVPTGKHGSTFGGNPLCCAAACAAIEFMLEQHLDRQAAEKGAYLLERLRGLDLPIVRDIRGLGLMIGVELRGRCRPYILELLNRGVITLPTGSTVIRLLPPLIIEHAHLDFVIAQFEGALSGPPQA